jgi:hypothetical protein
MNRTGGKVEDESAEDKHHYDGGETVESVVGA